jgi:hypothetical protein
MNNDTSRYIDVNIPDIAIEEVYQEIIRIVGVSKITSSNFIGIVLSLMRFVENYTDIRGELKKELIMKALDKYISAEVDHDVDAADMRLLVQLTLPSIIDSFVSIDKKQIQIKLKKCNKWFTCIC